ncbi:MAG: cellulase family glycosylhydrolase [Chitinophagales bacterium]|nr:cellulase family glycosylhydrolase [Chitinophagales bacterium]MCZ2392610.1 cellulase family glycosylhydrolase [Chitinophagales bacterium]
MLLNRLFLGFSLLFFLGITLSCKKDNDNTKKISEEPVEMKWIADEYGRQLILHGLNTSSSAKSALDRMPWIAEVDVEREATQLGFNFVRLLIFWDFVEPEKGVFNSQYLDEVQKRVEWYTSRGMYVMLDMHQDLYSLEFGGDGAPAWAIESNGASWEVDIDGPWWLKNISPAVINSWTNFWGYSDYKYLQDHYIQMWKFVATRFKSNPRVIGYDLMNEPWGGDLMKTFISGEFERNQLSALYARLIPELRTVDTEKYLFFEPAPAPVTFGMPSRLRPMKDILPNSDKLVYAPHVYPLGTHEGKPYGGNDKKNVVDWHRERKKEVVNHGGVPLLCGEFGLSPGVKDFDVYLKEITGIFDENQWHWAYWSNDDGGWSPLEHDGTETAIAQYLVRAYPKATAGKISSFSFNWDTKVFNMEYVSNPSITQPTEIFIPRRHFPNGYELNIESESPYTTQYNDVNQVLTIKVEKKATVKVSVKAK